MSRFDAGRRLSLAAALVLWTGIAFAAPQEESGKTEQEEARTESEEAKAQPEETMQAKLQQLGLELMEPPAPVANYVRAVRTGNLVYLAGHGPLLPDGTYVRGKLGEDLDIKQGYEAGRLTCLALLASLKAEIGSLDRVRRIVQVEGMVNSAPDFTNQPEVINGCSDLLVKLFGERGRHARSAVGMASLPIGIAVEIQMVVEVE